MAMLTSPLFAGKFDKAVVYSGGMTIADETASARQIAAAIAPLAVEDKKAADEKVNCSLSSRQWKKQKF